MIIILFNLYIIVFIFAVPMASYCLGVQLSYILGWILTYRYILWVNLACSVLAVVLILTVTESPVYLLRQNREEVSVAWYISKDTIIVSFSSFFFWPPLFSNLHCLISLQYQTSVLTRHIFDFHIKFYLNLFLSNTHKFDMSFESNIKNIVLCNNIKDV